MSHDRSGNDASSRTMNYPRLLMLDISPVGQVSATGQLKALFLEDWPKGSFMQIWERNLGHQGSVLHRCGLDGGDDPFALIQESEQELLESCREFEPDVFYVRPVGSLTFLAFVERVLRAINVPVVLHIMDDWMARLESDDPKLYEQMEAVLQGLIDRANVLLSISEAMTKAFRTRYGREFVALANGVDLADFPLSQEKRQLVLSEDRPLVLRYVGALAEDMTLSSVRRVATTVSSLQSVMPIRLEIYTMRWFRKQAKDALGDLDGVTVHTSMQGLSEYRRLLQTADILLIAYNFDERSIAHVRLSMANKMPECLASGTPLLAFGPRGVATIDYLLQADCAAVVVDDSDAALKQAIQLLSRDQTYRKNLVERARAHVARHLSKSAAQSKFRTTMQEAARLQPRTPTKPLIGPLPRAKKAAVDETKTIAELLTGRDGSPLMIDVGAHYGSALRPFLDDRWRVLAFEPDNSNRSKLENMLSKHKHGPNVILDSRALSDTPSESAVFYSSEQSTGISGLSAFHETHESAGTVQVTTLTSVLHERSVDEVEFLKIDTEGFDLKVLRGFPWQQCRPRVIECEFEDKKTVPLNYDFHDLARFLLNLGYRVYVSEWHPIVRYGIRHDWCQLNRYPCQLTSKDAWGNLLAFRDGVDEADLASAFHKQLTFAGTPEEPHTEALGVDGFKVQGKVNAIENGYLLQPAATENYVSYGFSEAVGPGCLVEIDLGFTVDRRCRLRLLLCRTGSGPFEGAVRDFSCGAGNHSVRLRHRFEGVHGAYRVQVGVEDCVAEVTAINVSPITNHKLVGQALEASASGEKREASTNWKGSVTDGDVHQPVRPGMSLVTPSFNQHRFLTKMLDSVKSQSTQPCEHIILDAGSTDGSIELLREYARGNSNVTLYIGKDSGQTNAINQGFTRAQSEIVAWLNTDDCYASNRVLETVTVFFDRHPQVDIVYGNGRFVDEDGKPLRAAFVHQDPNRMIEKLVNAVGILQPSLFMRRRVFEALGPLQEQLQYSMDYEYWIRAAKAGFTFAFLDQVFSEAVLHSDSKTWGQREAQLQETVSVCRGAFGFAASEWIARLVGMQLEQADGILQRSEQSSSAFQQRYGECFREVNGTRRAMGRIWSWSEVSEMGKTLDDTKRLIPLHTRVLATASDSKFFHCALTQLAALQRSDADDVSVLFYDLGLARDQRDIVERVKNVYVVDYPEDRSQWFDEYFGAKTYGFKPYAMHHISRIAEEGTCVLWMDAGIAPLQSLETIWHLIESEDAFIVNHDDAWGDRHYPNMTFATDSCVFGMNATNEELLAPHLRAGIFGFRVGGRYQDLISQYYAFSQDVNIIQGEKHVDNAKVDLNAFHQEMSRQASAASYSREDLRKICGFLGHRHDQSILSILAARHDIKAHSARRFCARYKHASEVSKTNWSGSLPGATGTFDSHIDKESFVSELPVCVQHRGLFRNQDGLKFDMAKRREAFILGNGPSLRGFDLKRLAGFEVFGMNAAYRYWDQIGWYPDYYSCLDLVVGLSHKEQIKRLIENARDYGIKAFLLRKNLIVELGNLRNSDRVVDFDDLRAEVTLLSSPTVTTGSHTAAWAAHLGYEQLYLLGIDCNYVEILSEAERGRGTELTIIKSPDSNPNYFFDDYQQPGDKYNIPNPNRDVHLESWREVAEQLSGIGMRVFNANPLSKVDAFDFCELEPVVVHGQPSVVSRESMFFYNLVLANDLVSNIESPTLLSVGRADYFAEALFSCNGFTIKKALGQVGKDDLSGVSYLQLHGNDAALEGLSAVSEASFLPDVVECRISQAEAVGGKFDAKAKRLAALGYAVYLNAEHDEPWHTTQNDGRRFIPYGEYQAKRLENANLFAFRNGPDRESLSRATAQLELNYVKRLRLRGIELKAFYAAGEVIAKEQGAVTLKGAPEDNFLCFAYTCFVPKNGYVNIVLSISTEAMVELDLVLCRDGSTQYERAELYRVQAEPGSHRISVSHTFRNEHFGVRLQIGTRDTEARIHVEGVRIRVGSTEVVTEPTDNPAKPFVTRQVSANLPLTDRSAGKRSFAKANELFRQRAYEDALRIYLELHAEHPLFIYRDNAQHCARKLRLKPSEDLMSLRDQL